MMLLEIIVIVAAADAFAALELWLFWQLGEHDERRRATERRADRVPREERQTYARRA